MHPVVYYIIFFLAIGAIGMAWGSSKQPAAVKRQRWLKYFTYIFFTGVVVLGIFFHFFPWVAALIVAGAMAELWNVNAAASNKSVSRSIGSIIILSLLSAGFILFSITFHFSFLIFIYFQVMVFDGFCQITGQILGRHFLAPSISPAKTWEGLIGGWVFCIGVGMASANWVGWPFYKGALFGLLTGAASFTGDITASWYKRKVGVKDYSNWLPGQGGFLDRFDSFLMTGFVYWLICQINLVVQNA
jgi:phosphatidate cytidylyltransferase